MKAVALFSVLLAVIIGCHDATIDGGTLLSMDSTRVTMGIAGEVVKSPTMPVARLGQIDWAPLPGATVFVSNISGKRAGYVISDSLGRFFVQLSAGTYLLEPQKTSSGTFPRTPPSQTVTVTDGRVTRVRFDYDTGIR